MSHRSSHQQSLELVGDACALGLPDAAPTAAKTGAAIGEAINARTVTAGMLVGLIPVTALM